MSAEASDKAVREELAVALQRAQRERDAYKSSFEAELDGNAELRRCFGALPDEGMWEFVERLAHGAKREHGADDDRSDSVCVSSGAIAELEAAARELCGEVVARPWPLLPDAMRRSVPEAVGKVLGMVQRLAKGDELRERGVVIGRYEIRPPGLLPEKSTIPKVFLAGSIDMGAAVHWQSYASSRLLDDRRSLIVLNPRRADWDSSWAQRADNEKFASQVNWELKGLEMADVVLCHFDPDTKSPVTMLELGLCAQRHATGRQQLVVSCPKRFWRRGNVELVCARYGVPFFGGEDSLLAAIKEVRVLLALVRARVALADPSARSEGQR